jgi:hypothetical protein
MGVVTNEKLEDYGKEPELPQEGTPQTEAETSPAEKNVEGEASNG